MGLFDSLFDDDWTSIYGGGSGGGDYSSLLDDIFGGGGGSGQDYLDWVDWSNSDDGDYSDLLGSVFGDSGSGSSGGSNWGSIISSIFGGGSGSGGNIWTSLLGGLSGYAEAKLSGKDLKEGIAAQGKEQRKTIDFEAALKDYYTQQDKVRKRRALDTYGQFSLADRIKPGYTRTPDVQLPTKPTAG